MYGNVLEHFAAATQAEMRKTVVQQKQQYAKTRASLMSGPGARSEAGQLTGLEIPYYRGVPHSSVALDPIAGTTSFGAFIPPPTDKMYVGLSFMGYTVEWEHFHEVDAGRGKLPETRFTQRNKVMRTFMQHANWYTIGIEYGTLAVVSVGGGSGTITMTADGTARERSKGSIRLAVSFNATAGKRILYESYTTATHLKTATFYITSKASATTAVVVITDGGTIVAGDVIVKSGHYRKVPYGLGYHINQTARLYQGADTSVDTWLNSRRIPGGSATITPTLIDTAKLALDVRGNDNTARKKRIAHLTHGNYRAMAAFGYNLRTYNAEQGKADTTYGVPRNFEDEDTEWVQDEDFEDAYVYMRDRSSYFEYRQSEMQKVSKNDGTQWVGLSLLGSTEFYDNYCESFNLAYDSRGDDGQGEANGAPNSSVLIDALTIPVINQVSEGISLV
jgi:hypothetical protein